MRLVTRRLEFLVEVLKDPAQTTDTYAERIGVRGAAVRTIANDLMSAGYIARDKEEGEHGKRRHIWYVPPEALPMPVGIGFTVEEVARRVRGGGE